MSLDNFQIKEEEVIEKLNKSDGQIVTNSEKRISLINPLKGNENNNLNKPKITATKIKSNINRVAFPKSYTSNLIQDVKKDSETKQKLITKNIENKQKLLEERKNKHKDLIYLLTFIHSVLFIVILTMQYEVYLRFNIRKVLIDYFNVDPDAKPTRNPNRMDYPFIVFRDLASKIQENHFWFHDKKFEIITNIRITQRLNKESNLTSLNLQLDKKIRDKIHQLTTNNYYIDPYSGFNKNIEYKDKTNNGEVYQIKNSNFKL